MSRFDRLLTAFFANYALMAAGLMAYMLAGDIRYGNVADGVVAVVAIIGFVGIWLYGRRRRHRQSASLTIVITTVYRDNHPDPPLPPR